MGAWLKPMRRPAVLVLVAGLLASAALLDAVDIHVAMMFAAAAMGAENTTFERDGEVSIGLTYMTGTLVKLGQRLAGVLTGRADACLGALPAAVARAGERRGGGRAGAGPWWDWRGSGRGVGGALALAAAAWMITRSDAA